MAEGETVFTGKTEADEADLADEFLRQMPQKGSFDARDDSVISEDNNTAVVRKTFSSTTLADLLSLSNYQIKLLQQTWPKIYSTGATKVGNAIFNELCSRSSVCREMFQKAAIVDSFAKTGVDIRKEHARWLLDILNQTVRKLRDPVASIVEQCQDFGVKHAALRQRGLGTAVWDMLGDCLLDYVRKTEAVRKHRDLARAWALIITFLVDLLKEGQQNISMEEASSKATRHISLANFDEFSPSEVEERKKSNGERVGVAVKRTTSYPHSKKRASQLKNRWNTVLQVPPSFDRGSRSPSPTSRHQSPTNEGAFASSPPQGSELKPSGSTPRTLAETLGLTNYQQQLLQQSWRRMYFSSGGNLGADIFYQLCARNVIAKQFFQKANIVERFSSSEQSMDVRKKHGKAWLELVDSVLKSLNVQPSEATDKCLDAGSQHHVMKGEGFVASIWDEFGDITLEFMHKTDMLRKHRELARAWAMLISFMVDTMKDGQARFCTVDRHTLAHPTNSV